MKKITDPEPKCPKCGSYQIISIKPKSLAENYKAVCKDCWYSHNLDMFYDHVQRLDEETKYIE